MLIDWCCEESTGCTRSGRLRSVAAGLIVAAFLGAAAAEAQEYEIWALDQGTHIVHI